MNLPSLLRNQALPCAITLSLLAAGSASAADGTWTGGTSAVWATTNNWLNGIVAGTTSTNADIATFNSATYLFQPTAANSYFLGGLVFDSSNGGTTITTGTGNNRLNIGSSGIEMKSGTGAVNIGFLGAGTQGVNMATNQSWANNSGSLLTVNRAAVDDVAAVGTYTLTINGTGSGGVTMANGFSDLASASDANRLFALVIDSTGGNTTISGTSTYTGGTTLTRGNLLLGANASLGTGSVALNGGKISSSSTGAQVPANNTTIGGNVTLGDAVNTGKLTFSGTMGLGGATRTLTTESEVVFSNIVSNGGITKQGASVLTFLGASANTYTGLTTVSAGGLTLSKTAVNAIAGNVLVDGTGTLTLGASDQIINTSSVEVAAGTLALATFNETVNGVKLTGGTITGTTGVLTSSTAYDFQSSANVTGSLAGATGANKTTAGTVTFSGGNANTYTGLTTVSAGSLVLNRDNNVDALAGDVLVNGTGTLSITKIEQIKNTANVEVAAGTLAISGNAETVNGVKLTGGAITGSGANSILTSTTAFDFQSGSSTAVLSGTAGLTKTTGGTVSLGRASTYSGGTTLTAGTLQLGVNSAGSVGAITSGAIGTGSLALNGGTLSSGTTNNRTILNTTTIGGDVTLGDATNDGKLNFSAGVDLGAANRTLTTASSVAFNGAVSGSGGITKAGSATLTLSTNNSYLGNTVLSEGSLIINGDQSSATGALTVASGSTLGGSGTIGGATTISGIHSPGTSPGVQTFNNGLTYSNGSTFVWELTGNTSTNSDRGIAFDGVNVSGGTLTINGGVTNNLVFNGAGSTVSWSDAFWDSNQQWLVFDNASLPTVSSNVFDTINVGFDSISQSLTTVRSGSSFSWDTIGDELYLTYAIPEPSTYALLALLGAGFAGRIMVRRRRRHGII